MAEQTPREHRKFVALECRVDGISQRNPLRLSDLSLGGGFVDTQAQLQPGDRIVVTFTLNDREFQYPATVAHLQKGIGFGFRFVVEEMSPEAIATLKAFVAPDV